MRIIVAFSILAFLTGCRDGNSSLEYGESGFPKNCRALIKANIDGWHSGEFKAEDALSSIDRNCGEFGITWGK